MTATLIEPIITAPPATGGACDGHVAGAVLREARRTLSLNQEQAAERLGLDLNTYRAHEHGRRPLARVTVQRLRAITRGLTRLGVAAPIVDLIDVAIDVDLAIGQALVDEFTEYPFPPGGRGKAWHELLAWAVLGTTPTAFTDSGVVAPPRLSVPDQNMLLRRIRYTVDRQADTLAPGVLQLLRRVYLGIPGCPAWCDGKGIVSCAPDDNGDAFHFVQVEPVKTTDPVGLETVTAGLVRNDGLDGVGRSLVDLSSSDLGDNVATWSTAMTSDAARTLALRLLDCATKAEEANR